MERSPGLRPTFFTTYWLFSTLILLSLQIAAVAATTSTRIIDDTNGDSVTGAKPVYSPADQFSQNSDCSGCVYHPDASQTKDGTWHDTTQIDGAAPRTVSFAFTGTSLSIFCILANQQSSATTVGPSYLSLNIDDASHGTYSHTPDGSTAFLYNQQVFSVGGLSNAAHRVVLSTNNPAGSYMLFDYATYLFDDGKTTAAAGGENTGGTTQNNPGTSAHTGSTPSTTGRNSGSSGTTDSPNGASASTTGTSSVSSSSSGSLPDTLTGSGSSSPQKQSNLTGVIAGAAAGIVAVILTLFVAFMCLRRRQRRRDELNSQQPWAFVPTTQQTGPGLLNQQQPYTPSTAAYTPQGFAPQAQQLSPQQQQPQSQTQPIHGGISQYTDTSAQAQLSLPADERALVPELHYGRAGVGDPEKAALRQSLFDLRENTGLRHQPSTTTLGSRSGASSTTVGRSRAASGIGHAMMSDGRDEEASASSRSNSRSRSHRPAPSMAPSFQTVDYADLMSPPPDYEHSIARHPMPQQGTYTTFGSV